MKKYLIIYILSLSVYVLSCHKKDDPGPVAEFSFTADGVPYIFTGNYFANKGSRLQRDIWWGSQPTKRYWLEGAEEYNSYLIMFIVSNDLRPATYDVTMGAALNNIYYDSSANCRVVINSLENNLASGTFSGELLIKRNSIRPVIIANGKFSNVQVKL